MYVQLLNLTSGGQLAVDLGIHFLVSKKTSHLLDRLPHDGDDQDKTL